MSKDLMPQHKRMAMGKKPITGVGPMDRYASGGSIPKGLPTTPLTDSKRANGIPEMKRGGKSCG